MSESGYEGWAIVELMGHRRLIGKVSEATIAGTAMLRIDVLTSEGETTQFYGAGSIYCLTPTDEQTARRAASLSKVAPITVWELPAPRPAAATSADALERELDEEAAYERMERYRDED